MAVEYYDIKVKLNHEIISMEERNDGWIICIANSLGKLLRRFDYVIVSSGLFTDGKFRPQFPGQEVLFINLLFIYFYFIILKKSNRNLQVKL